MRDNALVPLPEPWFLVPENLRARLEDELRAEVRRGHPMHGEPAVAIAWCGGCDDVLFGIGGERGEPARWAIVHLTGSNKRERLPWPRATIFDTPADTRRYLTQHEH
jgi:hypothetical protein